MTTSRVDAVKVPGCFVRIEGAYATLRAAEQRVADFILKHPDELIYLTVTELAERTNTSESTVEKWESGAKKPSGMALKLLDMVEKHGLKVLA